jgi:hypothetical protein
MKTINYLLATIIFTSSAITGWGITEKNSESLYQEVTETYKKVSRHYRPILELYEAFVQANLAEKDYFIKKLAKKIIADVQEGNLPLYGNIFNRIWRQSTACSGNYPLKKFEQTFLQDSIGHVKKSYTQLEKTNRDHQDMERFIRQLKEIGELVKSSVYYEMEDYKVGYIAEKRLREQAEARVRTLEQLLAKKKKKNLESKVLPRCALCNK